MKTILFYWSKGAEIRRRIIKIIGKCNRDGEPCYISSISKKTGISHVAIMKHLKMLKEEGYVETLNPKGKPKYLKLTEKGEEIFKEFSKK